MRTERDTAHLLHAWLDEPVELDDRGLDEVLHRLPDLPQRRHRWLWPLDWRPIRSGATRSTDADGATAQRRYLTMLTPTRIAAITAVIALSGTLALISGPLAPAEPMVPATENGSISMEPAYFTGTLVAWQAGAGETEVLSDRSVERWPVRWTSRMSDPRVSGQGAAMDYLETIAMGPGDAVLTHTGVGHQSNDEGAYMVECHGAGTIRADGRIFCWYEGVEAYAGLTAFLILSDTGSDFEVEGWIYPGERPPLLEFVPEAGD